MPGVPMVSGVGFTQISIDSLQIVLAFEGTAVIAGYDCGAGTKLHHDPAADMINVKISAETEEGELGFVVPGQRSGSYDGVVNGIVVRMGVVDIQGNISGKILGIEDGRGCFTAVAIQPGKVTEGEGFAGRLPGFDAHGIFFEGRRYRVPHCRVEIPGGAGGHGGTVACLAEGRNKSQGSAEKENGVFK